MNMATAKKRPVSDKAPIAERDEVTIRFAGDPGDGMQLTGAQFTAAAAVDGNDVRTLPDFAAEIRAPAGTLAGTSSFQLRFSSHPIHTPGDTLDALLAMNPAALRANLLDLKAGGLLIVNTEAFADAEIYKAGYERNPLGDDSLHGFNVLAVPMHTLNREAIAKIKLSPREADRCKSSLPWAWCAGFSTSR